ncbi:DUF4249 domain-containing protein [Chitinophaga rhizophila]|uniref:DUF4249 domain-containing protein n=1 Tax=Chitinophaga rhizophila TaxID=2866212 RepID=A0ABS7GK15_9BACT|nr:DUF4249 domain-containing protein [Chitinophaga rhizophila]MBW8688061.1 DUF4249 domain-containing protein [Chitinophaga rhizophila]
MRPLINIAVLVIAFTACRKESRIDIPYQGDKIVLNSLIQPDSLIYFRITRSKPVKEYQNLQFPEIKGADITLLENGKRLPAPVWKVINGKGYYVSQAFAQAGKQYAVRVAYDGLTSVLAADSTPGHPEISDAFAQKTANRVRFTLRDNAAERNYYRIRVYNADTVNGIVTPMKRDTVKFRLDPSFNNNFFDVIGNTYYSEVLLKDDRISGKEVQFVLQTNKQVTASYMMVEVSNLTESAYKYLDNTFAQRLENRLEFSLQPVDIYSNVTNGYGIIAGVNARVLSFAVE